MEGLMYPIFAIILEETFLSNYLGATPAPPGLAPKPLRSGWLQGPCRLPVWLHTHPTFTSQTRFPPWLSSLSHNTASDAHSRISDICTLRILLSRCSNKLTTRAGAFEEGPLIETCWAFTPPESKLSKVWGHQFLLCLNVQSPGWHHRFPGLLLCKE